MSIVVSDAVRFLGRHFPSPDEVLKYRAETWEALVERDTKELVARFLQAVESAVSLTSEPKFVLHCQTAETAETVAKALRFKGWDVRLSLLEIAPTLSIKPA